jgi:hypothetical protein
VSHTHRKIGLACGGQLRMLHTEDPIHQGSYAPNSSVVDRGSTVPLPEM